MLSSDSPIQVVPKIGPKYKDLLEKLGIHTVQDLLYHFPFRYEDFAQIKPIGEIIVGEHVTVKGTLGPVNNIFTRNGKKLTRAEILDPTGKLNLIWFNQHYIKNAIVPGQEYFVSGTIGTFDKKPVVISPEMEVASTNNIHTGRLVPVYPETYGISSKWLRSRINDITGAKDKVTVDEFLPPKILAEQKLLDIKEALHQIHFPDTIQKATCARDRFGFEEMFIELLAVEKRKQEWAKHQKGHKVLPAETEMENFYDSLPFELSQSQKSAIGNILNDLGSDIPMNRLLEGDVGSGKTVVAIAAALATFFSGLRTIYLAPTEILANQHFATFKLYLENYGVSIGLATGTVKTDVEHADVVVGTHALLFTGKLMNIGLVVIDEQHRFGVEQRGKLLDIAKDKLIPNLLTLTATPIPRTLALTLYGDLEISVLDSPRTRNRNVETVVLSEDKRQDTYKWIAKNMVPTFIVCPLIEPSESETLENVKSAQTEYLAIQKFVSANKIGLLHGKMSSRDKQEVIDKFTKGDITVLVATPVIEVGIDIPDATVMIIESGERYGLASLHQLRGRVGRRGQKAYCMIFMSNFSRTGYDRLKNLETVEDGIKLAEIDLKMRGEGDIFSTLQHGYKRFKIASLDNLKLLESAKKAAQEILPEIDKYPKLLERLKTESNNYVRNN